MTFRIQQEEELMHKMALARRLGLLGVSLAALALSQGVRAEDGPDHAAQNAADHIKTASPIKHVLIIVGENRSFDHLFATYGAGNMLPAPNYFRVRSEKPSGFQAPVTTARNDRYWRKADTAIDPRKPKGVS